jgi:hypothetical protein
VLRGVGVDLCILLGGNQLAAQDAPVLLHRELPLLLQGQESSLGLGKLTLEGGS